MSKYTALWEFVQKSGEPAVTVKFDDVPEITGVELDHSFLREKKECIGYGYQVRKISMKQGTILFEKADGDR